MSLERFRDAQARIWPAPLEEIRAGRKVTHWMWFVFPQIRGLGHSAQARYFAIANLAEAQDFLAHDELGARLREISAALLAHAGSPPQAILGAVDALKLHSSMTLFHAAGGGAVFRQVLDAFYDGARCRATGEILKGDSGRG